MELVKENMIMLLNYLPTIMYYEFCGLYVKTREGEATRVILMYSSFWKQIETSY
jgi:hypothetical protein